MNYPRRVYWQEARRYLLDRASLFAATALGIVAVDALFVLLLDGYLLGLVQATFTVVVFFALQTLFHAQTGALWQLQGAWGEDNTRDLLGRARRKKHIWGWVDGIETDDGDIDHLVLMRDGRFVAIDSKWHSVAQTWMSVERDAAKSARAARRASLVLRSLKLPHDVQPLVVLWGYGDPVPHGANVGGVLFVRGRDVMHLLEHHDGRHVAEEDAARVLVALDEFKMRVRPSS